MTVEQMLGTALIIAVAGDVIREIVRQIINQKKGDK